MTPPAIGTTQQNAERKERVNALMNDVDTWRKQQQAHFGKAWRAGYITRETRTTHTALCDYCKKPHDAGMRKFWLEMPQDENGCVEKYQVRFCGGCINIMSGIAIALPELATV